MSINDFVQDQIKKAYDYIRYSNVHYKSKDHYIVGLNGDNSGKTTYEEILPSVALSWQFMPQALIYASYAKGFETPTFMVFLG